jgi:hypothetical protein
MYIIVYSNYHVTITLCLVWKSSSSQGLQFNTSNQSCPMPLPFHHVLCSRSNRFLVWTVSLKNTSRIFAVYVPKHERSWYNKEVWSHLLSVFLLRFHEFRGRWFLIWRPSALYLYVYIPSARSWCGKFCKKVIEKITFSLTHRKTPNINSRKMATTRAEMRRKM